MNKIIKYKKLLFLAGILLFLSYPYIGKALGSEPGSEQDPIVTQSYVEMRNQQLKYYIDENINGIKNSIDELSKGLQNNNPNGSVNQSDVYQVVTVPANKKLILGASAEFILRAGKATAIDSPLGGLADVTMGKDLKLGESIPLNHLLIVPRDDGRGAKALVESIFMVKGSYSIQ